MESRREVRANRWRHAESACAKTMELRANQWRHADSARTKMMDSRKEMRANRWCHAESARAETMDSRREMSANRWCHAESARARRRSFTHLLPHAAPPTVVERGARTIDHSGPQNGGIDKSSHEFSDFIVAVGLSPSSPGASPLRACSMRIWRRLRIGGRSAPLSYSAT